MALGAADALRDTTINQGIGGSNLASQQIQRQSIDEMQNLNGAIAESRAIQEQQRQEQLAKAQELYNKTLKSPASLTSRGGFGSGNGPVISIGLLNTVGSLPGHNTATLQAFLPGGGGGILGNSIDEIKAKIKAMGLDPNQLNFAFDQGTLTPENIADPSGTIPKLVSDVQSSGIQFLPSETIARLRGTSLGGMPTFSPPNSSDGKLFTQVTPKNSSQNLEKSELSKLGTPSASSIDWSKISPGTQARIIDAGLSQYISIAKSTPVVTTPEQLQSLTSSQRIALAIMKEKDGAKRAAMIKAQAQFGNIRGPYVSR